MTIKKKKRKTTKKKSTRKRSIAKVGDISLLDEIRSRLNAPREYFYEQELRIDKEIKKPASWFSAVQKAENVTNSYIWRINKEKIYQNYTSKYCSSFDEKGEEIQVPLKDFIPPKNHPRFKPTIVVVLPNGKAITPIRQFCETKILPSNTKEAYFYNFGPVTFPTNEGEKLSLQPEITATHAGVKPYGSRIDIKYDYLEKDVTTIISATNRAYALESIYDENHEILERVFKNARLSDSHCIDGNTGKPINYDKLVKPLTIKGLIKAKEVIENEGLDTSEAILYTTGKAIRDLIMDPDVDSYLGTKNKKPEVITQHVIERITGIKLVRDGNIPTITQEIEEKIPLPETYWQRFKRVLLFKKQPINIQKSAKKIGNESVLFLPNISFGLVSGETLTMEAQRRAELLAVAVVGTQRLAGVLKTPETTVRIRHS